MREYDIRKPQMSEELAEFLGICYGDGNLYINKKRNDYMINISCHLHDDYEYLKKYVSPMINNLFGLDVKFYERKAKTVLSLYLRSKKLLYFLNNYGMVIGKKTGLSIPPEIRSNNKFMLSFIRGFTDTDGSLHFKRKHKNVMYYPTINISSASKNVIEQIWFSLKKNGFVFGNVVIEKRNPVKYPRFLKSYRIFLYGKSNLNRWIKLIGFSNNKHLSKYEKWKK